MNETLKKYTTLIDKINHEKDIDDMIDFGDWMALTSYRQVLAEISQEDMLTDEELYLLAVADEHFSQVLTDKQLKQIVKQEPELPIKEWWG